MSGWVVQIDPAAVSSGRTALDLNVDPIRVDQAGVDWGQAAIQAFMAQQSKYGSSPADFVVPNRTVTIPLFLGSGHYASQSAAITAEEDARAQLQQKIGLLQREGGWLLRQRNGGPAMYADVVNATLTLPDKFGETGGIEPDVSLVLECKPDFYGDEITLDAIAATGVCQGVLKSGGVNAVVEGDYSGRARIIVTDTSGNDQKSLLWGFRARHYDASTEAELFYEAEAMTPLNGATVTALAGASGGDVVKLASLIGGSWVPVLSTDDAPLGHTGSYRVWVRAYSANATPQLRLLWGVGSLSVPVTNDPVTLPGSGTFYLLDLGEIRLDAPPIGSNQWVGVIQALAANTGDSVSIDCVYFQPLDDGAGQLTYVFESPASAISGTENAGAGADNSGTGTVTWSNPGNIIAQDGSYASASGGFSHWLEATSFGFSVPSAATIQGILATIVRENGSGGGGQVFDEGVRLIKAGVIQTTDRALTSQWPFSFTSQSYGGPTDLWGGTWIPSDINSSGFGAALAAAVSSPGIARVDLISITVYYSLGGFTVAQDAVIYSDGICEARHDGMFRQGPSAGPYGPVSQFTGDLVRLPPSGLEGRAVQLFAKPSRGDVVSLADAGLDAFTAQVKYRPCWIFRP